VGLFHRRQKEPPVPREWFITKRCLDMIVASSKSSYPKEFGALLRVDEEEKHMISEVVLLPGTISGNSHAIFRLNMLPIDYSVVGTVHSHPSSIARPSDADLDLFGHFGRVHLIVGVSSYGQVSWRAYDHEGRPLDVKVK
jgi:proteasome lid subunit RPN8/RPN11